MFGKRTLDGPVFFGEDTQDIIKSIIDREIEEQESLPIFDFIQRFGNENNLIVIDNAWVSYVRDIRFDYFNKEIFVPYFRYKEYDTDKRIIKKDGHLYINKETGNVKVRYEYELSKFGIHLGDKIVVYDFVRDKKIEVRVWWYTSENFEFSLERLYQLYLDSCYLELSTALDKHSGGYHVIGKEIKRFNDREQKYRKEYKLNTFGKDSLSQDILDYRDVRQFRREEAIKKSGLRQNNEPYWKRILDFESYLYCGIRCGKEPIEEEYRSKFFHLGYRTDYMKYGSEEIKLIIKGYWKHKGKVINRKSWSRV